jgi:hypothetical protein
MPLSTYIIGVADIIPSVVLLVFGIAEFIPQDGHHAPLMDDAYPQHMPTETLLITAFVRFRLLDGLHENCLKDTACSRWCNNGITYALDVKFGTREAGIRPPDSYSY